MLPSALTTRAEALPRIALSLPPPSRFLMPRIPILDAIFPDPSRSMAAIEQRLSLYLRRLKTPKTVSTHLEDLLSSTSSIEPVAPFELSRLETARIKRRAKCLAERVFQQAPTSRMKPDDRQRLDALRYGADLVVLTSEHRADEIAAELHTDFPWMAPATELLWHGLRRAAHADAPGLRLPPMLLDGPPGIGKSHWARRLAQLLRVPDMICEATNENASFGLVGGQRAWSNAAPGRMVNFILTHRVANPVIIVDEVEKAGEAQSRQGTSFSLTAALLPLLEQLSAQRWTCPYFEVAFDMSWITWVLTSNDWRRLPEPLLSRCPPIHLPAPSLQHLDAFARREGGRRQLSQTAIEAIGIVLQRGTFSDHPPDLRAVIRMLDRAAMLERRPLLH